MDTEHNDVAKIRREAGNISLKAMRYRRSSEQLNEMKGYGTN